MKSRHGPFHLTNGIVRIELIGDIGMVITRHASLVGEFVFVWLELLLTETLAVRSFDCFDGKKVVKKVVMFWCSGFTGHVQGSLLHLVEIGKK